MASSPYDSYAWVPDSDSAQADARYVEFLNKDPFPNVPPALLGSSAFLDYIRVTAMVHPFDGWDETSQAKRPSVKPASFELRPGDKFFMFDDAGRLQETDLTQGHQDRIVLPKNSITFVSTRERFRLPNYMAVRFNLRIKHVHRGLLLGTGPLIDPGWNLPILIPLHNLTDHEHVIKLDEGLIWVEFTKTYPRPDDMVPYQKFGGPDLPPTTRKKYREFLFSAGDGIPIKSSIPGEVLAAQQSADDAQKAVAGFRTSIRSLGLVGLVTLVLAVVGLLLPTLDLVMTATGRHRDDAEQTRILRQRVDDLQRQVSRLEKKMPAAPGPAQ